jgi:predicted RNase H-like nuclease (RuvC/YqgF family)
MRIRVKVSILGFVFVCLAALGGYAQQSSNPNDTSLGNVARELKAQKAKQPKPAMVITNDNIPEVEAKAGFGEGSSGKSSKPAAAEASGAPTQAHDKEYFRSHMSDLQSQLDTHKREFDVLQQKLGQNNMQYYPDPNKGLQQEYSRSDIDKLNADLAAKQTQISDDENAIDALREQLRQEGGDASWLP